MGAVWRWDELNPAEQKDIRRDAPHRIAAATANARASNWVLPTRYPVIRGASTPGTFATQFTMALTRPTVPRVAISPDAAQARGGVAASPHSAIGKVPLSQ